MTPRMNSAADRHADFVCSSWRVLRTAFEYNKAASSTVSFFSDALRGACVRACACCLRTESMQLNEQRCKKSLDNIVWALWQHKLELELEPTSASVGFARRAWDAVWPSPPPGRCLRQSPWVAPVRSRSGGGRWGSGPTEWPTAPRALPPLSLRNLVARCIPAQQIRVALATNTCTHKHRLGQTRNIHAKRRLAVLKGYSKHRL